MQFVPEEVKVVSAQITSDRKPFMRYLFYVVPAVAIIVAAGVMYALFHKTDTIGTLKKSAPVDEQKKVVAKPVPVVKEPPPASVVSDRPAPPPALVVPPKTAHLPHNSHLDLLIEASEDTWLSVAEDRNPPYQITLKAGAKLSPKAREFFVIDVGNAAGVSVTFLGKPLGKLGQKGQVVHLRLPQQ